MTDADDIDHLDPHCLRGARLLVVGDVMLDRYWFGDVERISPEAPVPVVRIAATEERLGGAANVAWNACSLGASAALLGIVGDDDAGRTLTAMTAARGIDAGLLVDAGAPTTVKLRVIGRQQQLLRVDFERAPDQSTLADKFAEFQRRLEQVPVLVLSDYGKGALEQIEPIIAAARERGTAIVVDPKGDDYARYAGATVLTPNRAELRTVVGSWKSEQDLTRRAQDLRASLGLRYLLLTRSEEGMSLYADDGAWHVPAQAREVFDVSGAGDTVVAVLAASLAAGLSMRQGVRLANRAGGIVVGKLGTAAVSAEELFKS